MCRQNKIDQLQKENDQLRSQISDQSQIPDEAVPLQNISDHFSSYSGPINVNEVFLIQIIYHVIKGVIISRREENIFLSSIDRHCCPSYYIATNGHSKGVSTLALPWSNPSLVTHKHNNNHSHAHKL